MARSFRSRYGAGPGHLALMLGCFLLVGYVVWHAASAPLPLRMAIWFAGAVIAHDFMLFPAYTVVDRGLARLATRRRGAEGSAGVAVINYVRTPLLLSALLLLVFGSVIIGAGEATYTRASGLLFASYLLWWAIVSVCLLIISLIVFLVRRRRSETQPAAGATTGAGPEPLVAGDH
ncbi:MAG: hypothetical protein ACR2KL_05690 [Nocardioidaceae bacterium]